MSEVMVDGEPFFLKEVITKDAAISAAGVSQLCTAYGKEEVMQSDLQRAIEEANKRAGRSRQKVFAKKVYLHQTDAQVIGQLCDRANDVLAAFYKNQGPAALRDAMKGLQEAVAIAGRRD